MNWPEIVQTEGFALVFKLTILLVAGWVCDWMLRRRHARWRLILWRGLLCASVALPLAQWARLPGIRIPITVATVEQTEPTQLQPRVPDVKAGPATTTTAAPAAEAAVAREATGGSRSAVTNFQPRKVWGPVRWEMVLGAVWGLGCALGMVRLVRLSRQLNRLRSQAKDAGPELQRLAAEIGRRLVLRRSAAVRVSEQVNSPFVFGLWRPTIMVPMRLTRELPADEMSALLSHELAHLRQNDLPWCLAWQGLKAVCWFHPLMWQAPAAHQLACEQEADRVVSGGLPDVESYPRLLSRLALRVLSLPTVETTLTANGSSQIANRLRHLGDKRLRAWRRRDTVAAFVLCGLMFFLVAGCAISGVGPGSGAASEPIRFAKATIVVQDEDGKPIAGATVTPFAFRVKGIHSADGYGWITNRFGPRTGALTDAAGKALVNYPVNSIPEEKEVTGALCLVVSHPEYASASIQTYFVDRPEKPIRLERGIHVEVSGYYGADHQVVPELVPSINGQGAGPEEWTNTGNGVYAFHRLSPGGHLIQLMGRLASGEIVYSDSFTFEAQQGKDYKYSLELKPGIRVEGRLDDRVQRPVKNGRVLISVRPKGFPAWDNYAVVDDLLNKYDGLHPWKSYRLIAEDGTFVFEGVPPGGLDVVVQGDGFVSQSPEFKQQTGSNTVEKVRGFALPLAFDLKAPVTKIEVTTEPTATLEVTIRNKSGQPIGGAWVGVSPNVVRMGGILGNMGVSSEAPYRVLDPLPRVMYSATTDAKGVAVVRNFSAETESFSVEHKDYEVPLRSGIRDRYVRTSFAPGQTNRVELTMERKGTEYIGSK